MSPGRAAADPGATQKSFKRAVRERMAKTGERYTAARAHLLPAEPAWGGAEHEHKAIAARLRTEHAVPGWWAQGITVGTARFDWGDGATRVVVGFTAKGDAKSEIALSHERLPDADVAPADVNCG